MTARCRSSKCFWLEKLRHPVFKIPLSFVTADKSNEEIIAVLQTRTTIAIIRTCTTSDGNRRRSKCLPNQPKQSEYFSECNMMEIAGRQRLVRLGAWFALAPCLKRFIFCWQIYFTSKIVVMSSACQVRCLRQG